MARAFGWKAAAAFGLAAVLGDATVRADEPKAPEAKPAPAAEKRPPAASDEAAKQAITRFDSDFKTQDIGKRMNAIHALARTKNDLVTEKLGKLLSHTDHEIRMGAAMALDSMAHNPEKAGEILRAFISSGKEKEDEVMINSMLSLGRLMHVKAIDDMGEVILKHGNVFVKIEGLKAYAKMKDKLALLPILDLWLVNPQGYSWEGGEVTVDTGAPGTEDQEAAEAAYKQKYGNQQRRGAPPTMLKTYIQQIVESVFQITGKKMNVPSDLMKWMVEHEAELPFKLPGKVKTTLKEWEERAAKKKKKDEEKK